MNQPIINNQSTSNQLTRVFDIIAFQAARYPNTKAIVNYEVGSWKSQSIGDCRRMINQYSQVLLKLGLKKGNFLLIAPELATPEWIFLDFAAQQIGVVVVPIHATFHKEQFDYILEETASKVCFLWDENARHKFLPNPEGIKVHIIKGKQGDKNSLSHLLNQVKNQQVADLENIKSTVQPSDLSTIIYTSGTTGMPKGVMLSHQNIMSNLHSMMLLMPVGSQKVALSFLPFSHVFERSFIYLYIATGCSVHLVNNRAHLSQAFREVRPHFFTTVPRILEKIYEGVLAYQAQQNVLQKNTIKWALKVGRQYQKKKGFRPFYWVKWQLSKLLAFHKLKKFLGDRVEAVIVGAAYLQPDLARVFAASGIKIREGYGMTETSPAITFNRFTPGLYAFGTVGVPIPGMEVKIDHPDENGEGEIMVKGPNVMQGYFKKPEETAKVLSLDGWLKTGDVGKFVQKRFLQITDRKKDIFKTSSGKYIAPQRLEKHFGVSPYIDQIMIVGFQKPFVTALIFPNFVLLKQWAKENEIHWTSPQYMVINIKIKEKIEQEIALLNKELSNFQRVRKFHLLYKEWSVEEGQLSYTMKFIRPNILSQYSKAIGVMYA